MVAGISDAAVREIRLAALAVALLAGCRVSVDYSGTAYQCDQYGRCPPGFDCRDGVCVPAGTPGGDAGVDAPWLPVDAAGADASLVDAAPPDAEVAAACGTLARLVDDFDDGVTGPQWEPGYAAAGTSVAEEDGQLVIRVNAGAGDAWAGYSSLHVHDLSGNHAQVRIDQVGPLYTVLEVRHHDGPRAQLLETASTVRAAVYGLAEGNGERAEIPYDSTDHRWWRIREQDGVLYWELSADGTAWTTLHQEPNPFLPDMVYVLLSAGGDVGTDAEARMDELNPDGDPDQRWCPIAVLADGFEDGQIAAAWADSFEEPGCWLEESGGVAKVAFDGTPDVWCGYETAPVYDACDGALTIEIAEPLAVSDTETWLLLVFPNDDASAEVSYWGGQLYLYKREGPNTTMTVSTNYNSGQHRWWRIRESGGTLSWETSPNGSSWSTQASQPTGADCSTTYVNFGAGVWNSWTAGAAEVHFDNLNPAP